jgi:hypothetical protein
MKVLQEITEWATDFELNNNTYFVTDNREKMLAYIKFNHDTVEVFKKPYPFNIRGRKFKEIENIWNYSPPEEVNKFARVWRVTGSKGNEYAVTLEDKLFTCSCSGFKFRNSCRHVASIQLENQLID